MARYAHCFPFVAIALGAFSFSSCSERAQQMEEHIIHIQRQLDDTQRQLQAANQALASRPSAESIHSTTPVVAAETGGLPSRETLEASYKAAAAEFREKVEPRLGSFRIGSCTLHSVQMPKEFYPFTSQISFAFVGPDGTTFTTDIPVKADVTGKWIFPAVDEVIDRVGNAERMAHGDVPSITDAASRSPASGKIQQPPQYMPVDGTVVIRWPGPSPTAAPTAATNAAPAAISPVASSVAAAAATPATTVRSSPQPSSGQNPAAVMPVDRDVHIQFPTPQP
jgi:hypothetical protein